MNLFPFDLVLAVSVAWATIFLGFLPVKTLRHTVLARETLKAAFAWAFIAVSAPTSILHFPLGVAGLSLLAWWQFRRDEPFAGKMWLSMASGLGISLGVMLLLAVTPFAYPTGKPPFEQGLLIASVYLGGAVIGLAYVCIALINAVPEVTRKVARRYVDLLLIILALRTGLTLLRIIQIGTYDQNGITWERPKLILPEITYDMHAVYPHEVLPALALLLFVVPSLGGLAWFSFRAGRLGKARNWLTALAVTALVAELLARHLAL